jgi:hypothetical protein
MKIRINKKPAGIVLLVALFIIVAAGIVIAGYLTLMQSEKKSVSRSQTWNNCVPVMEAGVEEAMAQIHACGNSTNLSSNSWTYSTNGYYQKTRFVGTDGSYCLIQIQPVSPPVIYSTAHVAIPGTASLASTNYITREVKVTTKTQQPGAGGVIAKGSISLSGGAYIDSFDSSIAPYQSGVHGTNAMALTDSTASGAISLSAGAKLYGIAVTGPGGSVSGGGITGGTLSDANVQINDVGAPNTTNGWTTGLSSGTNSGTNYTYLLSYAKCSYLSLTSPGNLTVAAGQSLGIFGPCTLWVSNLTVSTTGFIYLAPNASLTLYVSGTMDVSGGGIVNMSGYSANLTVYGLPTCSKITYSGSASFVGTVDAPEADITYSGTAAAYGSFTGNSFNDSGGAAVHYDQSLGAAASLIAATWNEL